MIAINILHNIRTLPYWFVGFHQIPESTQSGMVGNFQQQQQQKENPTKTTVQ